MCRRCVFGQAPGAQKLLAWLGGIRGRVAGFFVPLLVVFLLSALPAGADTRIDVLSLQHDYSFAESLDFALVAQSDSPVLEVVLFYGHEDDRLVRRIYPAFAPGTSVRVEYTEHLERGQFAPGTHMRAWWELRTEDGSILTTEPVTFEYTDNNHDWRALSGERVDLFWYGRDELRARELLAAADKAMARLQDEIGVSAEGRVRLYSYNSESDMQRAISQRSEGYDDRVMTLGVAVGDNTLLLLGTHRMADLVIAHELSHIVVRMATDNPYAGLPRWLDEGLAMYAEGELPADNRRALKKAVEADKLLSIRSMSSYVGRANQVDLFYGEAHSVVDFLLREHGREKIRDLLSVFAEGVRQEEALQRVYGLNLDELDARWRASLGLDPRQRRTEPARPAEYESQTGREPVICPSLFAAVVLPLLGVAWASARGRR